jgi:autotransporter strand-loop-strand O-heptosyltransferase
MKILVKFTTKSLGDTIGGMPAVLEFQKREKCEVYVECAWSKLFRNSYPTLNFDHVNVQFDKVVEINYHFDLPLQEGFARDLGFTDWTYIRPKVDFTPKDRPIKSRYASIGMHTTAQCKYWNYPNGWDILSKMLRKNEITPVCIDQGESFGVPGNWNYVPKSAVRRLDNSIEDSMNYIYHSDFFVGVSSGMAWVAHAMGKKVVMISGVTHTWNEFVEDCVRIINPNVCHGCFHEVNKFKFDPMDWMWCPINKGTNKQFECSKTITPEYVINQIKENGWI